MGLGIRTYSECWHFKWYWELRVIVVQRHIGDNEVMWLVRFCCRRTL